MDRRFLKVLGVSLLSALAISGIFLQFVRGASGRRQMRDTRDLVVAAHSLPVGVNLKPEDLKVVKISSDQFPRGGFSKVEEVMDRPVALSILPDEPVPETRLAPKGSGSGIAPAIPPGMRAVSVKVNEVIGVAGFVLPGMRVDVLATGRPPHQEGLVTRTVLQDILVLSAGRNTEADGRAQTVNAQVVTLLVTPEQAETTALASEWRIQLVLRNGSDRAAAKPPGRAAEELFGAAHAPPPPHSAGNAKPRPAVIAPPPAPAPPAAPVIEEVVVFRGNQKTVEPLGVRKP